MIVEHLELIDIRNYETATFELRPGTTVVLGDNGHGKTNLAEALAYLATLSSFRGVPSDALVRLGADRGVIRATIRDDDGRQSLIEAELTVGGRNRVQVNRQRLPRVRDLLGTMRVTVFSPDDLVIVKGGPGDRRRFLDDTLVALAVKYDAIRLEVDRVVKQRNTVLKSAKSSSTNHGDLGITLDVWDSKLSDVGGRLAHARATLVDRLGPMVQQAYRDLAGTATDIELGYVAPWRDVGLETALAHARDHDMRRGVTSVGPHRDDLTVVIDQMPSRTHASQGEQRTLALSLRLAAHRLVTERTDSAPVLVLDDVLSELDRGRAGALLDHLPAGQVVITSATDVPGRVDHTVRIVDGQLA
ncbi:MAG: DNA replication/repair protein RecF [Ilumatobacteraceae bacterium]|nr:DNA replication/repair protein RecF [Ilumatobacteraceae bacterium]